MKLREYIAALQAIEVEHAALDLLSHQMEEVRKERDWMGERVAELEAELERKDPLEL